MPSSISPPAWHNTTRTAILWAGILTGPIVWLLMLEANYVLTYVACETGHEWFLHATVLAAVCIVAVAGSLAWLHGPPDDPELHTPPVTRQTAEQRARWMAMYGVASSAWFVIVILANEIPILVLRACEAR